MKEFVLAFPLALPEEKVWSWLIDKGLLISAPTSNELIFKGIPFQFRAFVRPPHVELPNIFSEHSQLSDEQRNQLASHQSILFLLGYLKSNQSFKTVQSTIRSLLQHGALGIACEHSGSAYIANDWLEGEMEESMLGWLNWINSKGDIRTFGLECFGLPDLVAACHSPEDEDTLQVIMLHISEDLFLDEIPLQSGNIVEAGDGRSYMLRQEPKQPWPKGHPNYNAKGSLRLSEAK